MPLDSLPGTIVTFTRDQLRDKYLRDFKLRAPNASVAPGTQPYIDASVVADTLMPLYQNAVVIGNQSILDTCSGTFLDKVGGQEGVFRKAAVGSIGTVKVSTSSSGTILFAGDGLTDSKSGLRFQVTTTGTYNNGDPVPIAGIDTGPATNLAAGTVLAFTSPRPGCGQNATVNTSSGGLGLVGGSDNETDEQYRIRIKSVRTTRPSAGNDADLQTVVESTLGLPIQKSFTYPGANGPGTTSLTFTVLPNQPGGNRVPSSQQILQAQNAIAGRFPLDYQITIEAPQTYGQPFRFQIGWAAATSGYVDLAPWPPRPPSSGATACYSVTSVTSATQFQVSAGVGATLGVSPQVGQSIGFYDSTNLRFVRKRIATVSSGGSDVYNLTTDGVYDTSYVPTAGISEPFPWCEGANDILTTILTSIDRSGPSQKGSGLYGTIQRYPLADQVYPFTLTSRSFLDLTNQTSVLNFFLINSPSLEPTFGPPNIMSAQSITIFP